MNTNEFISVKELSQLSGFSRTTIWKLLKQGVLKETDNQDVKMSSRRKYLPKKESLEILEGRKTRDKIITSVEADDNAVKYTITEEDKKLVDLWNVLVKHCKFGKSESVKSDDYPKLKENVKLILRLKTRDYIIQQINSYFECCDKRLHINKDSEYSYKNINSFLRKLYKDCKSKEPHWWNKVQNKVESLDPHPKLTVALAKRYATQYYPKLRLPLKNPSREYEIFKTAGDFFKSVYLELRQKNPMITKWTNHTDKMLDYVIEVMWEFYGEDADYSLLSTPKFWYNRYKEYMINNVGV